jgi:hypothetical protein
MAHCGGRRVAHGRAGICSAVDLPSGRAPHGQASRPSSSKEEVAARHRRQERREVQGSEERPPTAMALEAGGAEADLHSAVYMPSPAAEKKFFSLSNL